MSGKVSTWTPENIRKVKAILGKHLDVRDALPEISQVIGAKITAPNLGNALLRAGEPGYGRLLKKAQVKAGKPRDIVAEREADLARKRDQRAVADMADEIRELRKRQRFIDQVSVSRPIPRITPREKGSVREMTAVALASDWHVEERVNPESVAGRNSYDLSIAEKRIDRFFQAIAWHIEHQRGSGRIAVNDLILWLGGDLMSGYIHEELMESNQLSPTQTILWLIPRLEGGIRGLIKRLDLASIVVPCSFGNHGRSTPKSRISTGYANSYEWLMYHDLAARLRDEKRVRFEITASAHQYVRVYDQVIHFHHGDSLSYQGGVGGIGIPLLKAIPQWDRTMQADVHCIGHFHQLRDYGRAVVNGSLIGFGPYSQHIRAEFEAPQQALFWIDSKRGKTMLTQLWVS